MPFPLPIDPDFRKEVVKMWIEDVYERLDSDMIEGAEISWKIANNIYLSLPPGCGDMELEDRIVEARVKITEHLNKKHAHSN